MDASHFGYHATAHPLDSARVATIASLSRREKDHAAGEARRKKMAAILSAAGKAGVGVAAVFVVKSAAVAATAWTTAPAMIAVFAAAATSAVVAGTWEYHAQKGDKAFSWRDWAHSVNNSRSAKMAFGLAVAGGATFSFLADIVQGLFGNSASSISASNANTRMVSGLVTIAETTPVQEITASAPEAVSAPEPIAEKPAAPVAEAPVAEAPVARAPVMQAPVAEVIPDYTNMPPVSDVTDANGVRTIVHASGIIETITPIYADPVVSAPVADAPAVNAPAAVEQLPAIGICDVTETDAAVNIDCKMDPNAIVQPGSGIDFRAAAQAEPFRVGLSLESEPQAAMEFLENHAIPEAQEAYANGRFSPKP